jgi:hypothetical protein
MLSFIFITTCYPYQVKTDDMQAIFDLYCLLQIPVSVGVDIKRAILDGSLSAAASTTLGSVAGLLISKQGGIFGPVGLQLCLGELIC